MQNLKAALLQFDQICENKEDNYDEIKTFLAQKKDFNLLLLPEMFHTGFTMNHEHLAEYMEKSEGINFLKALSAQYQTAIYTTIIIKITNKINTVIITNDNDYVQLQNPNTIIVNMQLKNITINHNIENYKIYKALTGEKSDNIKREGKITNVNADKLIKKPEEKIIILQI